MEPDVSGVSGGDDNNTCDVDNIANPDNLVCANNYRDAGGRIILTSRLAKVPPAWDVDRNGRWDGFIPDAYF
jgi:hypothetical protein